VREARDYIRDRFGADYVPAKARAYAQKVKGAQEAHEAIRPTSVRREPEAVKAHLTSEQQRLYDLIWKRFLASQMTDAVSDVTTADIHARPARRDSSTIYLFRATGSVLKFPGFRAVYMEGRDEEDEERDGKALPPLAADEPLRCLGLEAQQHFTEPPPRYSEASLIRALEEKGIGRPSTYAAIVSTIQDRGYVKRDGGRLRPQPLGIVVNDLLAQHFSEIVDLDFTANMEEELDDIARGQRRWVTVVKAFYDPFSRDLEKAAKGIPRVHVPTGETCELCGRPMVLKQNRWGRSFLSCSGFPQCRNAKPYKVKTGVKCPRCGGDLVERHARKGRRHSTFYGCSNYPTCNFATSRKPLPVPCPSCGGLLTLWGRNTARCTACDYKGPVPEEEREAVGAQSGQGTGDRE
jgi:DNA topoisomerase-1